MQATCVVEEYRCRTYIVLQQSHIIPTTSRIYFLHDANPRMEYTHRDSCLEDLKQVQYRLYL